MKKKALTEAAILRQCAEEILKNRSWISVEHFNENEFIRLLHELHVHQIELELQNQELQLAKEKAVNTSAKYSELFDFAPIGYYTLSKEGEILELNLIGAELLGKNRFDLKNRLFGLYVSDTSKPEYNLFLKKSFESHNKNTCELKLLATNLTTRYVYLTGMVTEKGNQCLVTASEITERITTEKASQESEEK